MIEGFADEPAPVWGHQHHFLRDSSMPPGEPPLLFDPIALEAHAGGMPPHLLSILHLRMLTVVPESDDEGKDDDEAESSSPDRSPERSSAMPSQSLSQASAGDSGSFAGMQPQEQQQQHSGRLGQRWWGLTAEAAAAAAGGSPDQQQQDGGSASASAASTPSRLSVVVRGIFGISDSASPPPAPSAALDGPSSARKTPRAAAEGESTEGVSPPSTSSGKLSSLDHSSGGRVLAELPGVRWHDGSASPEAESLELLLLDEPQALQQAAAAYGSRAEQQLRRYYQRRSPLGETAAPAAASEGLAAAGMAVCGAAVAAAIPPAAGGSEGQHDEQDAQSTKLEAAVAKLIANTAGAAEDQAGEGIQAGWERSADGAVNVDRSNLATGAPSDSASPQSLQQVAPCEEIDEWDMASKARLQELEQQRQQQAAAATTPPITVEEARSGLLAAGVTAERRATVEIRLSTSRCSLGVFDPLCWCACFPMFSSSRSQFVIGSSSTSGSTSAIPLPLREQRVQLLALAQVPLDWRDPLHRRVMQALYTAYAAAGGGSGSPAASAASAGPGTHWLSLGFQGNDPATDLRSCGMLGVLQLLQLAALGGGQPAAAACRLAHSAQQEFPLAVVGLNFTAWTLAAVRRGALDRIARKQYGGRLAGAADAFYAGVWRAFVSRWRAQRATMRESGFFLKRLEREAGGRVGRMVAQADQWWD